MDSSIKIPMILSSIFWLASLACFGLSSQQAFASEDLPEVESVEPAQGDYNFNWLDPEKKIYVLQNRKYLKAGHPILSVMGGAGTSNPYRNTYNLDPRFSYYISEMFGVEAFYTTSFNYLNSTINALDLATSNLLPSVREIRSQMGGMIHFVPWYAKINVFNQILYFDWYFGAGAGTISSFVDTRTSTNQAYNYVQQNLIGYFFSTGHQYYLSQSFIFRIDFTGAFYQAPINGLTGDTTWYSNLNFALGLGWRI